MPEIPSDEELMSLLLAEVHESESSPFATHLPTIWALYSAQGVYSKGLQYALAKQRAIDYLLFNTYKYRDVSQQGVSDELSQIFDHLLALKNQTAEEIRMIKEDLQASKAYLMGLIYKQAPIEDPNLLRNPNDTRYLGDPLKPWTPYRKW